MSIKDTLLTRICLYMLAAGAKLIMLGKICKGRGKSNHSAPETPMKPLETLPSGKFLKNGTLLGFCEYANESQPVCIPLGLRNRHTNLIGSADTGMSHLMKVMLLDDIARGHGIAVIDPHGKLVKDILELIPEENTDRVIYLDLGDPEWIPVWNPFCCGAVRYAIVADDIVNSFKSLGRCCGPRTEHILRQTIFGALHLEDGSLFDVSNLLRYNSKESEQLIQRILNSADNEVLKLFWKHDFKMYNRIELLPLHHSLSPLLTSETVQLMLSQRDSLFDFEDLIASGKILLVNLSGAGSEAEETLGCFMLTLLYLTATRNRGKAEQPFHIYCDEAHRLVTGAFENIIAKTGMCNVSLTLAHQFTQRFDRTPVSALSNAGSKIIFNTNEADAQYLKKALLDKVEIKDIISLQKGQAIAHIENKVVRFRTLYPLDKPKKNCKDMIIENSHNLYHRPIKEARKFISGRVED